VRRVEQVTPEELQMISATARLQFACDGACSSGCWPVRTPPDADIDESQVEETEAPRMAERSTPTTVSVVQRLRTTAATVMGIARTPSAPARVPVAEQQPALDSAPLFWTMATVA
jgi:hypothetical protein